jgi:hypothetical protein
MLQAVKSMVAFPISTLNFLELTQTFQRQLALGFIQPLTEMSTRNIPGGKVRPARKADNLTAICESIV